MRAQVPGTKHSSTLDRDERPILEAIEHATRVQKLKTDRMARTGPTHRRRLQLQPTVIHGTTKRIYAAWLFIGAGKRHLNIYPCPAVTTEALVEELEVVLARYNVVVEMRRGVQDMNEEVQQEHHIMGELEPLAAA